MKLNQIKFPLIPKEHAMKTINIAWQKGNFNNTHLIYLLTFSESQLKDLGIHYAIESVTNHTDPNKVGDITRLYIGLDGLGIVAQCCLDDNANGWYECYSNGNFKDNPANGGNWSSMLTKEMPEVVTNIIQGLLIFNS